MRNVFVAIVFLLILATGFFVCEAGTSIYKYVDENGIVCFADNLQAIPENFRQSAILMPEEPDNDPVRSPMPAAVTQAEEAPVAAKVQQEVSTRRPLGTRMIISGAVGIAAILVFIVLSRIPAVKEKEKTLSIIRGSLIAIVSLYIIVAHIQDVMTVIGTAGRAVEDAQNRSAEKGKKAGKAVKQYNELVKDTQNQVKQLENEQR